MRPLFIALAILLPMPGYAATGGVFCKGTMSFVARPEPTGALSFKIMGSDPRQNIIEIEGLALHHANGWRYQVTSTSTPADRCTLDIVEISGGYAVKSVDGARCENSGGYGAYEMVMNAGFPAASRMPGVIPPAGKADDFPAFDCAHKRFYSSNEPVMACGSQVLGAAPVGVVRGLVMQDTGGWGKIFADKPTAIMRQYFTDGFNASWTKAMSHDEDVLDGDPITGYQQVTRVEERSTTGGETGLTTAKVTANLSVTAGGETKPEKVVFDLKLEHQHWKIEDITSGSMPSIRTYFRKSYGA